MGAAPPSSRIQNLRRQPDRTPCRYVAEGEATYFLTVIDRGADRMVEEGLLFPPTAEALKSEAKRRVAAKTFFGFMSYVSQIATKPQSV